MTRGQNNPPPAEFWGRTMTFSSRSRPLPRSRTTWQVSLLPLIVAMAYVATASASATVSAKLPATAPTTWVADAADAGPQATSTAPDNTRQEPRLARKRRSTRRRPQHAAQVRVGEDNDYTAIAAAAAAAGTSRGLLLPVIGEEGRQGWASMIAPSMLTGNGDEMGERKNERGRVERTEKIGKGTRESAENNRRGWKQSRNGKRRRGRELLPRADQDPLERHPDAGPSEHGVRAMSSVIRPRRGAETQQLQGDLVQRGRQLKDVSGTGTADLVRGVEKPGSRRSHLLRASGPRNGSTRASGKSKEPTGMAEQARVKGEEGGIRERAVGQHQDQNPGQSGGRGGVALFVSTGEESPLADGIGRKVRQHRRAQTRPDRSGDRGASDVDEHGEEDDESADGFGSVGLLAFLVCFGLLFCVMEVAKCYCLLECRRRRSQRGSSRRHGNAEGRIPLAISRPAAPSARKSELNTEWVEVVVDDPGTSVKVAPDGKAKEVPSARGYAVADASHAMQEAIKHARRLSPRSANVVFGIPGAAGQPQPPPRGSPPTADASMHTAVNSPGQPPVVASAEPQGNGVRS